MNVLVTGGAGFLGSHLCEALVAHPEVTKVLCIDNLVTGSWENVDHLIDTGKFRIFEGDALEAADVDYNFLGGLDRIYHLASPTAPDAIRKNGEMTKRVNGLTTCELLRLAGYKKARMLFVSSVKVHGECPRVSDYISGKRVGEELCLQAGAKIARLANAYGPRMAVNDSRVVPTFITRLLMGQEISLWNGGQQLDSFCYVSDIVRALITFMESPRTGVLEFGAPDGISIANLAQLITKLIGVHPEVRTTEEVLVSAECHKVVDISKATAALGWTPLVTLGEGLKETIEYFQNKLFWRRHAQD
jgi:nucleoside-diphosphate-sugar epimerase